MKDQMNELEFFVLCWYELPLKTFVKSFFCLKSINLYVRPYGHNDDWRYWQEYEEGADI